MLHPRGLHLSVLFPFRLCHPPLLIPWGDITTTRTQWSLGPGYELQFKQVPEVTITLSGRSAICCGPTLVRWSARRDPCLH